MLRFCHATRASQGARNYQEDASAVWPGGGTLAPAPASASDLLLAAVLADGMGGHKGGALASRTICSTFLDMLLTGSGRTPDRLRHALIAANQAVAEKVAENRAFAGMGATLVGIAFTNDGLEWVSVGDSPLYLIRRGEIARLNDDHSLAPILDRMVADGELSPEQARKDPRRHFLRAAVSGEEIEMVDLSQRPLLLEAGDVVLLASDGIHTLEDAAIGALVAEYLPRGPDAVAGALLRSIESAGDTYQDNTTVVVVAVDDARSL